MNVLMILQINTSYMKKMFIISQKIMLYSQKV